MDRLQLEIDYWKNSAEEKPGPLTLPNITNKLNDAARFLSFFQTYRHLFKGRVLELGAGQGWASCLVKKLTDSEVIATDISPYAIEGVKEWEDFWNVKLYDAYSCNSDGTREADSSVDLVFCYASAHHFADHRETLGELKRVLKPNGIALYLYEPVSPRWLYPLAKRRVNKIRPDVEEDLIVPENLRILASEVGLKVQFHTCLSPTGRRPLPAIYYSALGSAPFLTRLLPSTAHIVIRT